MCKSEIFAETINLVSQETEIPAERILSPDKDAETVSFIDNGGVECPSFPKSE